MIDVAYDIETFVNVFTIEATCIPTGEQWSFEISERVNDSHKIVAWMNYLANTDCRMVGFNNIGFDYPVIHLLYQMGASDAYTLYQKAMEIINSGRGFGHVIWDNELIVPQLDLYKIRHYDNHAKSTSLKMLEFNMRSETIQDLPFEPGTMLTFEQMDMLKSYNKKDVRETIEFYHHTKDMITFREELSERYGRDFTNYNDTKIGKEYFMMQLGIDNKNMTQTPRPQINLADAILPSVKFNQPEFNRIKDWLQNQVITETKGIFKGLTCTVNDFEFVFGLGGIHGSVDSTIVQSDDEYVIIDLDVASYYPNLAIVNRLHPAHLGEQFCDIYQDVYEQRKKHKKGTAENAMLKLALNGVYGDSNNKYSPFYDPLYTMTITLNGQLLLCMLAEWLFTIPDLEMIQVNTDGLTVKVPITKRTEVDRLKRLWEDYTGLELESADYNRMFIRDVNNYIAEYEPEQGKQCPCGCGNWTGKLKRKGAYEYNRDWHQNQSAMVVPMAAEAALVHGQSISDFIHNHDNLYDFMLRTKVPRSSRLVLNDGFTDYPLQNITRYYISEPIVTGITLSLVKIMPPLAKAPDKERRIGVSVGWNVHPCNDITDATMAGDYSYYIQEAEKLVEPLR